MGTARETLTHLDHRLNIAMAASPDPNRKAGKQPAESGKIAETERHLKKIYAKTLHQVDQHYQGNIIFCDFDDLAVRGDSLYYHDQPVHILVESSEGAVPPEILNLFKARRLCLFNGPVTGLLSNKLNLALLSEHEDSSCFSEEERQAIKTFIPWTRKILPSETSYHGQSIQLIDFIRRNREQLVIKPAVGYGGQGVALGKNTPVNSWETVLQKALREGKWLVQEYVPSLPWLYQAGESGAEPHVGVWGVLVFGNRYGGGSLRLLPSSHGSGIVNVHQGASASVLLEVEK